jgi:hypothetical protein
MPGEGRLTPRPPGRGGMPGLAGAPAPDPIGRVAPGTVVGPTAGRGAVGAWEVKGLLPIRGGPEVARGTAGPGRGPAAGRAAPGVAGRVAVAPPASAARAAGATGTWKTSVLGAARSATGVAGAGATGVVTAAATTTGGAASTARGLSAVRAVAAARGAGTGVASAAGAGNDSLSLRTTGASMVEEADRTNSPNS